MAKTLTASRPNLGLSLALLLAGIFVSFLLFIGIGELTPATTFPEPVVEVPDFKPSPKPPKGDPVIPLVALPDFLHDHGLPQARIEQIVDSFDDLVGEDPANPEDDDSRFRQRDLFAGYVGWAMIFCHDGNCQSAVEQLLEMYGNLRTEADFIFWKKTVLLIQILCCPNDGLEELEEWLRKREMWRDVWPRAINPN